jgi:hypothetical protein
MQPSSVKHSHLVDLDKIKQLTLLPDLFFEYTKTLYFIVDFKTSFGI